eukprot:CAMPEP_0168343630 /NCGR_PEP_ID=MMETSP0213-20121227/16240_1 /TAXON_ID=151035 /ORGANISM="Euplotes harpa, Strain FSP1.4" /LENGTH=141 /DNA_ID=CAMNT_0008351027 /DNA_START=74 /DNA_END=502 /DNA_ORIENTATION=+
MVSGGWKGKLQKIKREAIRVVEQVNREVGTAARTVADAVEHAAKAAAPTVEKTWRNVQTEVSNLSSKIAKKTSQISQEVSSFASNTTKKAFSELNREFVHKALTKGEILTGNFIGYGVNQLIDQKSDVIIKDIIQSIVSLI